MNKFSIIILRNELKIISVALKLRPNIKPISRLTVWVRSESVLSFGRNLDIAEK
jgi:hypothetical protein